jgi:hypothetical protein
MVKLRAGRCGARWFTSKQALCEFVSALTPRLDNQAPPPVRTLSARQRASERAAQQLEALGI